MTHVQLVLKRWQPNGNFPERLHYFVIFPTTISHFLVCLYPPLDTPRARLYCPPLIRALPLAPSSCSAGNRAYSFFEDQIVPHREALRLHKIKTNPMTGNFHSRYGMYVHI